MDSKYPRLVSPVASQQLRNSSFYVEDVVIHIPGQYEQMLKKTQNFKPYFQHNR